MNDRSTALNQVGSRKVREALVVAYPDEQNLTLQIRNDSIQSVAILKTALASIDPDIRVTLDLQKLKSIPNEAVQTLLKIGAEGSLLSVSPESFQTLQRLRLIDGSGVTQIPQKFNWYVTCEPAQVGADNSKLSDAFVGLVATKLSESRGASQNSQSHLRRMDLVKADLGRYFSIGVVGQMTEIKLTVPLASDFAREAFLDFLKEQLPNDRACLLDLSVLKKADQQLCGSILTLLKSRHAAGRLPISLVIAPELQGIFRNDRGNALGYLLDNPTAGRI